MDDTRHLTAGPYPRDPEVAPGAPTDPTLRIEHIPDTDQPDADQLAPHPPRRRGRIALASAGVVVLIAALAAGGTLLANEQSRLNATRADLAALRSAQASSAAELKSSIAAQQQQLTALGQQLDTAKSQLQAAQSRLAADEKQLNITTQKLPPDLTELAAKVSPSVVVVSCVAGTSADTGTAFAIDLPAASGFATTLITAAHVVSSCASGAASPVLTVSSGSHTWNAHIRGLDTGNDVAILDTHAELPALKPAGSDPLVGQFVMAVGNPLGVVNNVTSGNVSQVYDTYVLDTAPVSNGNSGGPVVDKDGNVIGIVQSAAAPNLNEPVVENLNVSLRLSTLCLSLLHGSSSCAALH